MPRPEFTAAAYQDLEEILNYLERLDPTAAARWIDEIEGECDRLEEHPQLGPRRPELSPDLRFFPVKNYLIFYREKNGGVQIIRVMHGARKYGTEDF